MDFLPQSSYVNPAILPNDQFSLGLPFLSSTSANFYSSSFKYNDLLVTGPGGRELIDPGNAVSKLKKENYFSSNLATDILSFTFRLKKTFFMVNATEKIDFNLSYSKQFLDFIWNGNGPSMGERQDFNFGLSAKHYREYGFLVAQQITNKLTVGARLKYLYGFENIQSESSRITAYTDPVNYDITATSNISINTSGIDEFQVRNVSSYQFGKNNRGWGFDIGADYRFNRKWGLSGSIIDFGYINWNTNVRNFYSENPEASYTFSGFRMNEVFNDNGSSATLFQNTFDSIKTSFELSERNSSYRTRFSPSGFLSGKYYFDDFIYTNLTLQAKRFEGKLRPSVSAGFNLRIREIFDVAVNYTIANGSFANVGTGLIITSGNANIYLLTDNIVAAINYKNVTSVNARVGINFGFGNFFLRNDRDGDLITDREDDCPYNFGPPESGGCPDKDGDKVIDMVDDCPDEPGLKTMNGCPDRDGDGIIDKYDDCPDISGEANFKGCPDRDHDGIMDIDDKCPTDAGTPELKGCPDKDGDGIGDAEDLCPERKGNERNKGCPDDRDGDGVYDEDDKCPDVAGDIKTGGCPDNDSDNDGLSDFEDDCVLTSGPKENKGCPLITDDILQLIENTSNNLKFLNNSAEIDPSSFIFLEKLANWMNSQPNILLKLLSHTDNEGTESIQLQKSKERAESVKQYLINKNVSPLKISYEYFGSSKPIANNNLPEGRAKNNRVEFKVKFK